LNFLHHTLWIFYKQIFEFIYTKIFDFFISKFLIFLHRNFWIFYTTIFEFFTDKFLNFFTHKFLIFLYQNFWIFYTEIFEFFTPKFLHFFTPKFLHVLHQIFILWKPIFRTKIFSFLHQNIWGFAPIFYYMNNFASLHHFLHQIKTIFWKKYFYVNCVPSNITQTRTIDLFQNVRITSVKIWSSVFVLSIGNEAFIDWQNWSASL